MTDTLETPSTPSTSTPGTSTPKDGVGLWTTVSTPDGAFTVVADTDGIILASGWTDTPEYLVALVHRDLRPHDLRGPAELGRTPELTTITEAVEAYYADDFGPAAARPVVQRSGPFIEKAWAALRGVTAGTAVTYTELAERAGEPAAIRAAASACARNAAALFVPCHRVLRRDGSLGGFRYGLDIKRSLLDRETPDQEVPLPDAG